MLTNSLINKKIWLITVYLAVILENAHVSGNLVNRPSDTFSLDISGCALFHKLCSHLDDDLPLLSCSLNATYSNAQVVSLCQHKLWMHQLDLMNSTYLSYKLKEPCQEEPLIFNCMTSNEYNVIDCVLKKKSSVRDKNCLRMINKIESLIFNDWQIISNFLKNCQDDIQLHTCGRIPPNSKSLSQTQTIKCLQNYEHSLKPECQSEITSLNEMKYNTLILDKIIFAACNLDQMVFCPNEIQGSWLMYKCLLRHKYENGKRY